MRCGALLTCTAAWSLAAMMRLVAEHLRGVYSSLFSVADDMTRGGVGRTGRPSKAEDREGKWETAKRGRVGSG